MPLLGNIFGTYVVRLSSQVAETINYFARFFSSSLFDGAELDDSIGNNNFAITKRNCLVDDGNKWMLLSTRIENLTGKLAFEFDLHDVDPTHAYNHLLGDSAINPFTALRNNTTDVMRFTNHLGSGVSGTYDSSTILNGKLTFFCDGGSDINVYLNDVLIDTVSIPSGTYSIQADRILAWRFNNDQTLKGKCSGFRYWDLSAVDSGSINKASIAATAPTWKFNFAEYTPGETLPSTVVYYDAMGTGVTLTGQSFTSTEVGSVDGISPNFEKGFSWKTLLGGTFRLPANENNPGYDIDGNALGFLPANTQNENHIVAPAAFADRGDILYKADETQMPLYLAGVAQEIPLKDIDHANNGTLLTFDAGGNITDMAFRGNVSGSSPTEGVYYVAASGSDSNDGLTEATPFKTVAHANTLALEPGNQILFKKGDTFEGAIAAAYSGSSGSVIKYGAYGSGANPVIKGTSVVTGWTLHSGNIYKASIASGANQVFVNGSRVPFARTPNFSTTPANNYITIDSVESTTQFTCADLIGTDWTGATIIIRPNDWSFEARKVIACNTTTGQVTLESATTYPILVGRIFLVLNHIDTLSDANQCVIDGTDVYLWTSGGDTPANYTVEVSTRDYGITGAARSYIDIGEIDFYGFRKDAVYFSGINSNITINIGDYKGNGECAVNIFGSTSNSYITATNLTVSYSNRAGIRLKGNAHTVQNIEPTNIAMLEHIGLNAFIDPYNTGVGILAYEVSNSIIQLNRTDYVGYNGLMVYGLNNLVEKNRARRSCQTLTDGAGIYLHRDCSGSTVRNNICFESGYTGSSASHGLYFDNDSEGIDVYSNTAFRNNGNGIFLHDTIDIDVHLNTCFGNLYNQVATKQDESFAMSGNTLYSNILVTDLLTPNSFTFKLQCEEGGSIGVNEHDNVICAEGYTTDPGDPPIFYINPPTYWQFISLADYQTASGMGVGTTRISLTDYSKLRFFYNDTDASAAQDLSEGTFKDLSGNDVSSLTLDAFTSQVLVLQ